MDLGFRVRWLMFSVLPPLSNSWIRIILWLYIALNRTPNIDCYWGGQYPTDIVTPFLESPGAMR